MKIQQWEKFNDSKIFFLKISLLGQSDNGE